MSLILGTPQKKQSASSPRTPNTPHTPRPRDFSHTPPPELPPPSEPFVQFNTVTVPFPDASSSRLVEVQMVDFPAGERSYREGMELDEERSVGNEAEMGEEDWTLATSSTFLPELHTLARVIGNGKVLELRYLALTTQRTLQGNNETLIRINFPRTLRPITNSQCLCRTQNGSLTVIVIDDQSRIYRMLFHDPAQAIEEGNAFKWDPEQAKSGWTDLPSMELESSGMSVEGRVKLIWEAVNEELVVVAGNDGLIGFKLNGDFWQSQYFKIQSSAFFAFSSGSIGPNNRIISLKHHDNYIYCVTRDKRLRVFSRQTGLMANMIDLEDRAASAAEEKARKSLGKLGDEDILDNSLIQVVEDEREGEQSTIVLLFNATPDDVDAAGGFRVLTHSSAQGWEIPGYASASVGSGGKTFRGMHLERHSYGSEEQEQTYWRLWVTWEERDGASLEYVDMTSILEPRSGKEAIRSSEWTSVRSLKRDLKLEPLYDAEYWNTAVNLDGMDENEDVGEWLAETFLEHFFYPGRYSMRVLEDSYEDAVASLGDEWDEPSTESLRQKTKWAVESKCGAGYDVSQEDVSYAAQLKKAWVAYWYTVSTRDSQTRQPVTTTFVSDGKSNNPILVNRESVTIPIVADSVSVLRTLVTAGDDEVDAEGSEAGMASLSAESDLESFKFANNLDQFYPSLGAGTTKIRAINALSAVHQYARKMSHVDTDTFAAKAFGLLSVEDEALDVEEWAWTTLGGSEDIPSIQETSVLAIQREKGGDLSDFEALLELVDAFDEASGSLEGEATYSGIAVSVSSMQVNALSRRVIATQVLLYLLALFGEVQRDDGRDEQGDGDYHYILKKASTTFLNWANLSWLAEQEANEALTLHGQRDVEGYDRQAFTALLEEHDSDAASFEASETAYSLLHSVATCPTTSWQPPTSWLADGARGTSLRAIASIGSLGSSRHAGAGVTEARLGLMVLQSGNPRKAIELFDRFPTSAGGLYVIGRAGLVLLEEGQHLLQGLMKAVVPLGRRNWQSNDRSGLAVVLPYEVQRSGKPGYYRHLRDAFLQAGRIQDAMTCAELALRKNPGFDPALSSWLFTAALENQAFENALRYMLCDPKYLAEGFAEPVMAFVKALCNTDQFDLVFELNIEGLEGDIQQALDLLARNAHPFDYPPYHRILYGWAAKREDWRLAGIAAYQQADRMSLLKVSDRKDNMHVWEARAELLLLSKAALSMVEPIHAAFSQPAMNRSHGILAARVTNNIPADRYTRENRRELELVTYDVVLREMNLVERTVHLAESTGSILDPAVEYTPKYVVGALARVGQFDEAFAMARIQRLDLTSPFEALVDRCLGAAKQDDQYSSWLDKQHVSARWRGSPTERSWQYLHSALQRYDQPIQPDPKNVYGVKVSSGTDFDYHLAVFRRILATEPNTYIPPWLLQHLIAKCPDCLIREALKANEVGKAAGWAKEVIEHVQQSSVQTLPGGVIKPQYTPFTAIDQVVAAAQTHRNATVVDLGNSLKEDAQRRANAVKSLMTTITTTR